MVCPALIVMRIISNNNVTVAKQLILWTTKTEYVENVCRIVSMAHLHSHAQNVFLTLSSSIIPVLSVLATAHSVVEIQLFPVTSAESVSNLLTKNVIKSLMMAVYFNPSNVTQCL